MTTLETIPRRIFFDTGVVHYLWRYGEFVFDNVEIPIHDRLRLHKVPYGLEDLEALQAFCVMNRRNAFEIVVSQNSLKEVASAGASRYTSYLLELADYWDSTRPRTRTPRLLALALSRPHSSPTGASAISARRIVRCWQTRARWSATRF
jgi:hypothetical protein